jgi:hypothetical protein
MNETVSRRLHTYLKGGHHVADLRACVYLKDRIKGNLQEITCDDVK